MLSSIVYVLWNHSGIQGAMGGDIQLWDVGRDPQPSHA
jgi:hypothetical protein